MTDTPNKLWRRYRWEVLPAGLTNVTSLPMLVGTREYMTPGGRRLLHSSWIIEPAMSPNVYGESFWAYVARYADAMRRDMDQAILESV